MAKNVRHHREKIDGEFFDFRHFDKMAMSPLNFIKFKYVLERSKFGRFFKIKMVVVFLLHLSLKVKIIVVTSFLLKIESLRLH